MDSKQSTMLSLQCCRTDHVREEPRNGNGRGSFEAGTKLNVHAKEFTMSPPLQNSKSSGNLHQIMNNGSVPVSVSFQSNRLQHSKSSGNVLHTTSHVQPQSPPLKVHFAPVEKKGDTNNNYSKPSYNQIQASVQNGQLYNVPDHLRLKRSKSMNDALKKSTDISDLGPLPSDIHSLIQKASLNPNDLSQRHLMSSAKFLVEKAVENREYSNAAAKICATIIEKSRTETFVDSLFNTCQFIFKEREKLLRTAPSKYPAFLAFLYELYTQMKSREPKLKTAYSNLRTLTLIASCLLDFLNQGVMKVNSEVESLFFVFSSIGQDLEVFLPNKLNEIMDQMRIQFLKQTTSPSFRKTLLQMIELRASKWALPVESIIYYYPSNSQKK
ncbi:MIF4G domain-containing protein isoform X2 [Bemisia tabaci]|uniref:MIF4G domain-containing protein isoform X2 n=1 Tax=Bemisia tabaci TaxID=7038 RepID=UPI003B289A9F